MPTSVGLQIGQILAKQLETLDFETLIKVADTLPEAQLEVLPYITQTHSKKESIDIQQLRYCCRLRQLIFPNYPVQDNVLMYLPHLEHLTIRQSSMMTGEYFKTLGSLIELQILSKSTTEPDTTLCTYTVKHMKKLEMLHVMNHILVDEDFHFLQNLRILILISDRITPRILNYLPKLELCIINKKLYKYVSSTRNKQILKRIGKLDTVKIYAIENSQHL